jgi:hypothetical protein
MPPTHKGEAASGAVKLAKPTSQAVVE